MYRADDHRRVEKSTSLQMVSDQLATIIVWYLPTTKSRNFFSCIFLNGWKRCYWYCRCKYTGHSVVAQLMAWLFIDDFVCNSFLFAKIPLIPNSALRILQPWGCRVFILKYVHWLTVFGMRNRVFEAAHLSLRSCHVNNKDVGFYLIAICFVVVFVCGPFFKSNSCSKCCRHWITPETRVW